MNISPNIIYDVSITYTHDTKKRRKRSKNQYQKSILVRAPDNTASISRATRIFLRLHPNARIIDVDAFIIDYQPNNPITPVTTPVISLERIIGFISTLFTNNTMSESTR